MSPTKANELPRHWRRTDAPHRHAGRSLPTVATAAAGLALGGIVSWAVTGGEAYDGATASLGERRAVTAEGIGDDGPSSEAVVPGQPDCGHPADEFEVGQIVVAFTTSDGRRWVVDASRGVDGRWEPERICPAEVVVPFSRTDLVSDDRPSSATAITSGAAADFAITSGAAADFAITSGPEAGGGPSSPGATTPLSVSGWWSTFFAGAVGPTVTTVGDASTTTSAPSTTRPPAAPPTTTGPTPTTTTGPTPTTTTGPTPTTTTGPTTTPTTGPTTTPTTDTTAPPPTDTTAPPPTDTTTTEDPTSTTTEVDPTSTTDPGDPGEDG